MEKLQKPPSRAPALFHNIKFFVLCQGLLQFSQLLYSSYLKSSLSTIEKRYGLTSFSSGVISSLHEVGNMVLIVFVSYVGSRVHRPLFIGIGGIIMALSSALMSMPHFFSQPYKYSGYDAERLDLCTPGRNLSHHACGAGSSQHQDETSRLWVLMACAQLMFGIGSVPIQPFGLSYIDDFAEPGNSALYIAIVFAVSLIGPSLGYLLGSAMMRIYVDVDKTGPAPELSPLDPRWVGAWWMGVLIASVILALNSFPYFFFPRHMHTQPPARGCESDDLKDCLKTKEEPDEGSPIYFLKMFPRLFVRLLLSPFFLLLVLSQCCFSSIIASLSTFLNKFLERQYSTSAAHANLLIGSINLPSAGLGMLLGGVVMKRAGFSLKAIPRFSVAVLLLSVALCVPLFFLGCSTQAVAGVNVGYREQATGLANGSQPSCVSNCSCVEYLFNPVCGSDGVEYTSPCHAGCSNFSLDPNNKYRVQIYNLCLCIRDSNGVGKAKPGSCANSCPHHLLLAVIIISLCSFVASLSHNPIYMMVLRTVPQEEKSFAIGVQFLLMRSLAWLPAPAFFGTVIDSSCMWWRQTCSQKGFCGYYDNNLLRERYLGLQMLYKICGIFLLCLVLWKVQKTREYSFQKKREGSV